MQTGELRVLGAGIFDSRLELPAAEVSRRRTVRVYEIELFIEGGVSYLNGTPHPIARGNLLVARPGDRRHSVLPAVCRFLHFFTEDPQLQELIDSLPPYVEGAETPELAKAFDDIRDSLFSPARYARLETESRLLSLLLSLYRQYRAPAGQSSAAADSTVARAISYLEEHYAAPLSAPDMARHCRVSLSYLYKLFSKSTGMSPNQYLLRLRIAEAKRYLTETALSSGEIAEACGFSSQAYFCSCFKTAVGMTPGEFRRRCGYPDAQKI